LADSPLKAYTAGLVNGGDKTTGVPPQELVIVSVPVPGAFTNDTVPPTEYCCVAVLQAVGVALTDEIAQMVAQDAGAAYGCVNVQVVFAENTAVTLQAAPLDVKPVNE